MSDESFLGGIGAYLFGPKATKYTRPEPEPFPAREDVIAARDYKERFGNPNEVMIKGERVIEPPHGNVRYRQEGTPLRQVSKGQAADAWNEYRLPENRDKEILSKVNKTPLDEAAAEIEFDLRGRGETDLDFFETDFHEQIEILEFLIDAHGLGEGLIAVAEIDAAPDRGLG